MGEGTTTRKWDDSKDGGARVALGITTEVELRWEKQPRLRREQVVENHNRISDREQHRTSPWRGEGRVMQDEFMDEIDDHMEVGRLQGCRS